MPGISIKNILNNDRNKEKEVTQTASTPSIQETNDFSQNDLVACWKEYIQSIPEKKILSTTMQSCTPVLKENYFVEVPVDNPIQEKEILNERNDLIAFLSKKLKNGKIHIYIKVNEQGENKKSLSPQERFKSMLERNPNIEHLRSELGLEVD
jgi:DNA polymerase-3 subunit gamma/tau